jgi:hypothetical protein
MTAAQATGAGDAVRLERRQRRGEGFDASQMGAIGAGAADDLGAAVNQKRDVAALHGGGDSFGAIDEAAFVGAGEAKQHGGDVGGIERGVEVAGE